MRNLFYILAAMMVIASGYWAYQENYTTQAELDGIDDLRSDIVAARARLSVLKAEWAYLNRPDRLRELADMNFERLGLVPLRPEQMSEVADLPQPLPFVLDLSAAVDVSSAGAQP